MNTILNQMLKKYDIKNIQDETNAMKEIIQEIVICGLSRGGFFNEAAFYGGTALRIFYGLNRFSEDLDFALLKPNKNFDITKYFSCIENEVHAYGLNLRILEKEKTKNSNILSAFLKGDTKEHILIFFSENNLQTNNSIKDIKIKFEVDINPPDGANYEFKYKLLPSPHQVRIYDSSSLFAGKIHAILCRIWNNRTKGRDLYDYIFYLSNEIGVNLNLTREKLIDSKFIDKDEKFDLNILKEMLNKKFENLDYNSAKADVISFIEDNKSLELWNADFFIEITKKLIEN